MLPHTATTQISPVISTTAATPLSVPTPAPICTLMVSPIPSIRFMKYLASCPDHLAQSLLRINLRPDPDFSPRPHIYFDFALVASPQLPPRTRLGPRQYLRSQLRPCSHPSLPFKIVIYVILFCTGDLSPTVSMPPLILTPTHTPRLRPCPHQSIPFLVRKYLVNLHYSAVPILRYALTYARAHNYAYAHVYSPAHTQLFLSHS